ncbi:MAG: hypothetical protein EA402_10825 [Planctomycetota bacterium]|nr:MAG: hypothetical protein EA402_10825 [Planctomycetota bacterium]
MALRVLVGRTLLLLGLGQHGAMPLDLINRCQRHAPLVVLLLVVVMGLVGVAAFFIALRPCVLDLPAGTIARYSLVTEVWPDEPGAPLPLRQQRHEITLFVYGRDGRAVLLTQSGGLRRGELRPARLRRDGRVHLLAGEEGDELQHDHGPAIGYFDFNLLVLPPGLDQAWDAEFIYAYPPPEKRRQVVRVRRTHNGARPRFSYALPAVEWVDAQPRSLRGEDERYVQMRDIQVNYRFDTRRGLWHDADISFLAGVEIADGYLRHRLRLRLVLEDVQTLAATELAAMHEDIQRLRRLQWAASRQHSEVTMQALEGLSAVQTPGLAALAARWQSDVQALPWEGAQAVQVASFAAHAETRAQALRWQVIGDGYPAYLRRRGGHLTVMAGPFAERDEEVLTDLRRRFPRDRPFWLRESGP